MRPLPQRRPLPNGRAALGALLIALAVVLLFSAGNGGAAVEHYVIARRPLVIGSRITAADLTLTAVHVPAGRLRSRVFSRPTPLVGAVVIAPVAAGELVQASAVVAAASMDDQRQVSVPVESARALGDRLKPGELVDVIATFGSGPDAFTVAVVRGVRVVDRDATGGPLGDRKNEVVILSVRTGDEAVAVAHAVAAGQISLIRVSGVAESGDGASAPYRAPRPEPGR